MESTALLAMVRADREFEIEHEGVTIRARVPTRYEMQRVLSDPSSGMGDLALRFSIGWRGVKVKDVIGKGDDESEAPFSAELFAEYAGQRLDLMSKLVDELLSRHNKRAGVIEAEAKN